MKRMSYRRDGKSLQEMARWSKDNRPPLNGKVFEDGHEYHAKKEVSE